MTPLSNGPIGAPNPIASCSVVVYGTSIIGQYSLPQLYSENEPSNRKYVSLDHNAHASTQIYDYIYHPCSHISTPNPSTVTMVTMTSYI